MVRLFIYLHGFGFKGKEHNDVLKSIALNVYNAEFISFNAPFGSDRDRGGFAWYDINKETKEHIFDEKIEASSQYIINKINNELESRHLTWDNIVLCGRSQGAMMALNLLLNKHCKPDAILLLCPYFPEELINTDTIESNTSITWIEAGNDGALTDEQKSSYQKLIDKGLDIKYLINDESEHNYLDISIESQLVDII